MDALSIFGLAATALMLVWYALEYVLGFAVARMLGAWPLGLVEIVALRRWRLRLKPA